MKTFVTSLGIAVLLLSIAKASAVNHTALADQISKETVKILEEKYHLQMIGWGGGTMYGVERLSLSFEINPPVTISQARKLVVECAQIYLNKINSNKELRPYLAEYPFTISRIELTFFVKNGKYQNSETLKTFEVAFYPNKKQTIIDYQFSEKQRLKIILSETYDEAIKLLTQENMKEKPIDN